MIAAAIVVSLTGWFVWRKLVRTNLYVTYYLADGEECVRVVKES